MEAIDNSFIDTVPPTFTWTEGQQDVPVIVSADFLELYNIFAPGYGLPQISAHLDEKEPIFRGLMMKTLDALDQEDMAALDSSVRV